MNDKTYNGWTNYATWRVNLEMFDGVDPTERYAHCDDVHYLGEVLKADAIMYIEDASEEGFARDYALAFISDVNWYEIAKHMADAYELFTDAA